jgi:hypothetical protein
LNVDGGQLFYGKPEPAWVINSRRRQYGDSQYSAGSYSGQPSFGPYSQGSALPDTVLRVPLINLEDVARIKDALSVEGNDHDSQDPLAHSNFL